MKKFIAGLFVVVGIVSACTKEEIISRPYARVNTIDISNINNAGAQFRGEIFYTTVPIVDHGFLWSPYPAFPEGETDKISLGTKTGTGTFETTCSWAISKGTTYYMRSYAISAGVEVLGDVEKFSGLGSSPPVITDVYPTDVTWGDTVTILGDNFSAASATNTVLINNFDANFVRGNRDTLWVRVSYYLANEYNDVAVKRQNDISTATKQLKLKPPDITMVSPATGSEGTTVTITGLYLATSTAQVYFNDKYAPLTNLTPTSLVVTVPSGLPSGDVVIKVVTGNGGLNDTVLFKIL